MLSLTLAVKLRFEHDDNFIETKKHFTLSDQGLHMRCQALKERQLKMAKKMEREEFFFWLRELNRKDISYRTAVSIKQRLVRMHERFDPEDRPELSEELLCGAVERGVAHSAKAALKNIRRYASEGEHRQFNKDVDMLRGLFRSNRAVVTEALGMSVKQLYEVVEKSRSARRKQSRTAG